jgi:hypothetical protein
MPDLTQNISDAGSSPQQATADGVSVSARSIEDMIKADVYAGAGKNAAANPLRGIRITKMITPGPIGGNRTGNQGFGGCP